MGRDCIRKESRGRKNLIGKSEMQRQTKKDSLLRTILSSHKSMISLKLWARGTKRLRMLLLSMDNMRERRLNRRDLKYSTKNRLSAISDLKFQRKVKKCLAKDMILMVIVIVICLHQFQINLWIFTKMLNVERRDKTRYIQHVWSQNVPFSQIQTRQSTITRS